MQPPETTPPKPGADRITVPLELRGDTISYALQHMAQNVAANFYEPAIDSFFQKKYYQKHKNGVEGYGSYGHNLAGQFAGDLTGGSTLIAAELLIPNQLHAFTRAARRAVDPLYDSVARWTLSDQRGQPDYEQQVQRWKLYQERSLVRSAIMVPASIAGNIAVQKAVGNPSPAKVIFGTKLISTALTTVVTLATRFMFPEHTRKFDNWVNRKVVLPLMENGQAQSPSSHTSNILINKDKNTTSPAL